MFFVRSFPMNYSEKMLRFIYKGQIEIMWYVYLFIFRVKGSIILQIMAWAVFVFFNRGSLKLLHVFTYFILFNTCIDISNFLGEIQIVISIPRCSLFLPIVHQINSESFFYIHIQYNDFLHMILLLFSHVLYLYQFIVGLLTSNLVSFSNYQK